jgi:hypothetical protein
VILAGRDLDQVYDLGATLGGYIIKDKLWFFAGVQYASSGTRTRGRTRKRRSTVPGNFINDPGHRSARLRPDPGGDESPFRKREDHQLHREADLSHQLGHRLSLSVTGTPTSAEATGTIRSASRAFSRHAIR